MSALDLFASALGAFILIAIVLFPYFPNIGSSPEQVAALRAQLQASQTELTQARQDIEGLKQELAEAKFPHLDLIIVLDTTGSMKNLIDGLKQELREMAHVLARLAPSLGVGIVTFNDRNQVPVVSTSQLKEINPGSANFNSLKNFIDNLSAGSAGGENNDVPEAVYQALQAAKAMSWRSISERKIIVVITDAPPYDDEYGAIMGEAGNFAASSGQSVSGVWVDSQKDGHNATADFLEELSRNGKGNFVKAGGSITSSILLALLDA